MKGKCVLLATHDLGEIEYASGSAADVGYYDAKGIYGYDILLVVVKKNETPSSDEYVGNATFVTMVTSNMVNISAAGVCNYSLVACVNGSGVCKTRTDTATYGIYPTSVTISAGDSGDNGNARILIRKRYLSTYGAINGTYTLNVYGIKVTDRENKAFVL